MSTERVTEQQFDHSKFYNPITDSAGTKDKLNLLLTKEAIADQDLFEAIADTFATIATMDFKAEVLSEDGLQALEWQKTDEYLLGKTASPIEFLGYYQQSKSKTIEREEESFIQTSNGLGIGFQREEDGSIKVIKTIFDIQDTDMDKSEEYEIPQNERRDIIDALLKGVSLKNPPSTNSSTMTP